MQIQQGDTIIIFISQKMFVDKNLLAFSQLSFSYKYFVFVKAFLYEQNVATEPKRTAILASQKW